MEERVALARDASADALAVARAPALPIDAVARSCGPSRPAREQRQRADHRCTDFEVRSTTWQPRGRRPALTTSILHCI